MKERRAFTLIELLVVVSIIALLVALLLPALHGARRQARAVTCQARLHQWALMFHQYTCDHDGWFFYPRNILSNEDPRSDWLQALKPYYANAHRDRLEMLRCPAKNFNEHDGWYYTGYGLNGWVNDAGRPEYIGAPTDPSARLHWKHVDRAKSPSTVPVLLDFHQSVTHSGVPQPTDPPPLFEGARSPFWMGCFCDTRHGSASNGFFMDWSVRKIGLKELWTLKWHFEYNTAGPWTKRGGALPEDWPKWMRKLKDY